MHSHRERGSVAKRIQCRIRTASRINYERPSLLLTTRDQAALLSLKLY